MKTNPARSLALLGLAFALTANLTAQTAAPAAPKLEFPAASPATSIKQRVGITDIELNYARPGAKGRVAMLRAANAHIELFEYAAPAPETGDPNRPVCNHGLTHICFDVVDLPAEYARLKAAGVPFHCEPQWLGKGTVLTTYARDPDGNVVEFQEILNPKSRMAMTF